MGREEVFSAYKPWTPVSPPQGWVFKNPFLVHSQTLYGTCLSLEFWMFVDMLVSHKSVSQFFSFIYLDKTSIYVLEWKQSGCHLIEWLMMERSSSDVLRVQYKRAALLSKIGAAVGYPRGANRLLNRAAWSQLGDNWVTAVVAAHWTPSSLGLAEQISSFTYWCGSSRFGMLIITESFRNIN